MRALNLLVVVLCFFTPLITCQCPTLKGYDLAALVQPSATPFSGTEVTSTTTYKYYWNFCTNLEGVPPTITALIPTPVVQVDTGSQSLTTIPIGTLTGAQFTEISDGLSITYVNNVDNKCKGDTVARATTINIHCDPKSTGSEIAISEPGACTYLIDMKHKAACKGHNGGAAGGLSGGSIFLIILLCFSVTYLIGGIVFKRFRMQATGIEMVPNIDFWREIPGLVADGCRFVLNKVRGGGGYAQV